VPSVVSPAAPAPVPIRPDTPPIPAAATPGPSEPAQVAADHHAARSDFAPTLSDPLPAQPEFLPAPLPVVPPAPKSRGGLVLPGALILLVGGGFLTWTTWRKGAPQASTQSARRPVAAPASSSPEPPAPAPAAPTPSPYESELVTTRTVWVRVIADGERVLERELPADTRVPIEARETLVIRTGDAGAVRLSIGGHDQGFLGREGEVTTRTFTVPDAVAR
jgi:hypothetical protein